MSEKLAKSMSGTGEHVMSKWPATGAQEFYDDQYRSQGTSLVEWLRFCAVEKVNSIQLCTAGRDVNDVLEIGCGTGAILERMDAVGFAKNFWAMDVSAEAIRVVQSLQIRKLQSAVVGEVKEIGSLFDRRFDLIILSHVLEHLPDPQETLDRALAQADYVFVEVPLESTIGLNLKSWVRALFGCDRKENISGHIQFFSKRTFEMVLQRCSAAILSSRRYVPMSDELLRRNNKGKFKRRLILCLYSLFGERLWGILWYSHYAALVSRHAD